jgi:LL-H family phage holin
MNDTLMNIVLDILSILIPALVAMGIAYLKKKMDQTTYEKIKIQLEAKSGLAWTAVTFVEQVYSELHGEEKYNKAAEWLAEQSSAIGIKLTSDQVKALVESAVKLMNDSIKQTA